MRRKLVASLLIVEIGVLLTSPSLEAYSFQKSISSGAARQSWAVEEDDQSDLYFGSLNTKKPTPILLKSSYPGNVESVTEPSVKLVPSTVDSLVKSLLEDLLPVLLGTPPPDVTEIAENIPSTSVPTQQSSRPSKEITDVRTSSLPTTPEVTERTTDGKAITRKNLATSAINGWTLFPNMQPKPVPSPQPSTPRPRVTNPGVVLSELEIGEVLQKVNLQQLLERLRLFNSTPIGYPDEIFSLTPDISQPVIEPDAQGSCRSNRDCSALEECQFGFCAPAERLIGRTCLFTSGCPQRYVCEDMVCVRDEELKHHVIGQNCVFHHNCPSR